MSDENDDVNETTLPSVEEYVPTQIGSKCIPHASLGFATLDDLKVIEADRFDHFPIHPARFAIYHLVYNGIARTELRVWRV